MNSPLELLSTVLQGTSSSPFGINFSTGLSGLYNTIATTFLPSIGAVFIIVAVVTLARGSGDPEKYIYAAMASVMVAALVSLLQTFTATGSPTTAVTGLIGYIGNVIMPIYGVWCIIKGICAHGGFFSRTYIGDDYARYFIAAIGSFSIAGLCKLFDYFVAGH
jgi:surface polysaccharide O-acyltransferase-like enzyme